MDSSSPEPGSAPVAASAAIGRPPAVPSIGREMAKGAMWMVLMRFAIRALGLVSVFILARLLSPQDFGLVALATSILLAVETLGQFNFEVALIQDQKAGRSRYDTAWTLNLLRAIISALAVACIAGVTADFFGASEIELVVYVLAVVTAMEGLQNIGIVDFRKDLNFRRDFQFMVYQRLFSFCVTLVAAYTLRTYWALVIGIASGRIAGVVLSYTMHHYRPRLSLKDWRSLLGFSKWLLFNNVLGFIGSKLDVFVIGRMSGMHHVGIYNLAYELASLPSTELSFPIQRAVFPAFSKIADKPDQLRKAYVDGLAVLMLIATPASLGIAILAEPLILFTMGDKWREAIPILQILSIWGIIRLFGANAGAVLLAVGRPRLITIRTMIYVVMIGPLLIGGMVLGGLEGASWGLVIAASINVVLTLAVALPVIGVALTTIIASNWRPVAASLLMAGVVLALFGQWPDGQPIAKLGVGVLSGAIVFTAAQLLLWQICGRPAGAEMIILKEIGGWLARRRQAPRPG
jgi:lipopolysaccharide exporter